MGKLEGTALNTALPKVILVDANFLVAVVSRHTSVDDKARIDHLLTRVEKAKSKIVIPMPAVAEYLVRADIAGIETLNKLERKSFIALAPFDRVAAFECAQIDRAALGGSPDKKDGTMVPWQKIKIDRQIVAIGKSLGAGLCISADGGVRNNALRIGIASVTIQELELPESAKQGKLALVERPIRKAPSAAPMKAGASGE